MRFGRSFVLAVLAAAPAAPVAADEGRVPRDVRTKRFATSIACSFCHANADDTGAMRDGAGRGVAPYDLWRSSMKANAARDPFFRAAVAAEVAAAPDRRIEIEARCLHCHAPMASLEARLAGRPGLAHADLDRDHDDADDDRAALARDGVSCTLCHQIRPEGLGGPEGFDGRFVVGEERRIFGPHGDQWTQPMKRITDYEPERAEHVQRSALCATCHTSHLTASPGGAVAELGAYLEWRNSDYDDERPEPGPRAATCQACHLPTTDQDGAPIRTRIAKSSHGADLAQIPPLEPFGRHLFVGGNTLLPAILRDHAEELHVKAPPAAFDATIARARELLAGRTATLEILEALPGVDSLTVTVPVRNLAGHKFPTGHASRRAWLRLRVRDLRGDVFFASGEHDAQGRIVARTDAAPLPFEAAGGPLAPHRPVVRREDEVQVYEAVLARAGKPEFHSVPATGFAKDNRLLPAGWRADHPDAAATAPQGTAGDGDFEAGGDTVTYEIPFPDEEPLTDFTVEVALLYQPLAPRTAAELFATDAPEVRRFERMYRAATRTPETVATAWLTVRAE